MNKIMTLLFLTVLSLPLVACSNQSNQTLDGEYYWVNESRNEEHLLFQELREHLIVVLLITL